MQSMTGYGVCQLCRQNRSLQVELKTVNHRYLDLSFRMPKGLPFVEDALRKRITASGLGRGHVDITITYHNTREDAHVVQLDIPLLKACDDAYRQACATLNDPRMVSALEVIQLSGALTITQPPENAEEVVALAEEAFATACTQLLSMRRQEGAALAKSMADHLSALDALVQSIARRAPQVPGQYKQRLLARLQEWDMPQADPQRIAQEVAIMADRAAIDEELSRLNSHIQQFAACLKSDGEVGRKLDFLLQEMNREINTIGAKGADGEIAHWVVEAKCTIEKLREQAQNVV